VLTQVTRVTPPGSTYPEFVMPVLVPDSTGLFISQIEGLEPVPENITTKAFAGGSGEYFVGRQRGKRNIVLHFGMESQGYDAGAVRESLDGNFYSDGDSEITLRFEFDDRDPVLISGFAETIEGDRFSSDLDFQISVICPKPNFIAETVSTATGFTDADPAWTTLTTLGNRDCGFAVKLIPEAGLEDNIGNDMTYISGVESATPGVYIHQRALEINPHTADLPDPMVAGEEFWMDSRLGQKSVYIYTPSTGAVRNALRGMTQDSQWPKLFPGPNGFRITNPYWAAGVHPMAWTAYWYDEFGGI